MSKPFINQLNLNKWFLISKYRVELKKFKLKLEPTNNKYFLYVL